MDRERELQLIDGLRAGDPAAFDAVFDSFNRRLYNFLARLTNRREIAEDLLEETWLRLVVHAPRLRPDTRLAQWLFTVARHLHASHCRSRLLENTHAAGLLGLWPSGRPEPSPLVAAEANETERRVMQALALLPLTYREALLLVAVEELQPAEAAVVCGVSPETMRQRLRRARTLLARRLDIGEPLALAALKEIKT
jgi:RNA polymerase sigma-70 factor (ECF subfamily)